MEKSFEIAYIFLEDHNELLHTHTCSGGGGDCSGVHLIVSSVEDDIVHLSCPNGCSHITQKVDLSIISTLTDINVSFEEIMKDVRRYHNLNELLGD